jgi:hypothetical protein
MQFSLFYIPLEFCNAKVYILNTLLFSGFVNKKTFESNQKHSKHYQIYGFLSKNSKSYGNSKLLSVCFESFS